MSATEELRRMLDERGVEWSSPSGLNSRFTDSITFIGDVAVVSEIDGSDLLRINFDGTPEQAIAATLGRGTCKLSRGTSGLMHVATGHCSECGAEVVKGTKDGYRSRYCQWCGAKVVEA